MCKVKRCPAPDDTDKKVGLMIKAIREHINQTVEELAKEIDLDPVKLKSREDGKTHFSASELWRIACHFNISIQTLFYHIEFDIPRMANIITLTKLECEMYSMLYACKPEEAENMIEEMKKYMTGLRGK